MDNSWKKYLQPLIYTLLLALGIFLGILLRPSAPYGSSGNKFNEVLSLIKSTYVDTVNQAQLEEEAISSLLKNLDPHSVYIPAADLQSVSEPLDGEFQGIGVEFNLFKDTILVVNVIPGGPSAEVGILPGDRIINVNGKIMTGDSINNEMVIKNLKGKKGTKAEVLVVRRGEKKPLKFSITRGVIPIYSVDAGYMLDNITGYIKISRFAATTHEEFVDKFNALKKKGLENLVLDLRGNPGGYLQAAKDISDEFLNSDKIIVYTEGRTQDKKVYKAGKKGLFENGKLIVLIDEGSASASEIVSGAVQDWDRGLIVGRRSFGKGLVQESFQLSDNSALRLTVSRYYTPTGRCIQKPYDKGYDAYQMDIMERYDHSEFYVEDSVKVEDSLVYLTPRGRKVYGGGGIKPDVFVAADSSLRNPIIEAVFRSGLLIRFCYSYVDNNRKELKKYNDINPFIKAKHKNIFDELYTYLISNDIKISEAQFQDIIPEIRTYLLALLARQIFDQEAYFKVINTEDKVIIKSLELIKSYDDYLGS